MSHPVSQGAPHRLREGARPPARLLAAGKAARILDEARDLLATEGVGVADDAARRLLIDHGARVNARGRVLVPAGLLDRSLDTTPSVVELFDLHGGRTHVLGGDRVSFTPGSSALHVLDGRTSAIRRPDTADYVRYAKVVSGLPHLAAQSTAFVPSDVPAGISDAYRLYLSLLHCAKPVVTGAFAADTLGVMLDLLAAARGGREGLRARPLAVFTCCPTSPLAWSADVARNLMDCARAGVPVEIVAVPLAGFLAPVTPWATLVQHAAENLSGVVIAQLAAPGAPLLWGGSAAIFDVRHETTPMGAAETIRLGCAAAELGRHLGLPTQAYMGLSDAKEMDAQAGLETAAGAVMAALSGINLVAGAGMLDFENAQSLEKLVLDDEACGMALCLAGEAARGEDGPLGPVFHELVAEQHLLISEHTLRHRDRVIRWPSPVIDRRSRARWEEDGRPSLLERARAEVARLEAAWRPPVPGDHLRRELGSIMGAAARRAGMDALPALS